MKKFHFLFGSLLVVFVAVAAFPQDEVIEMNNEALGIHQRPLVSFPHARHEENIGCGRCHHDFDDFGVNQNSDEGGKCADCHATGDSSKLPPLTRAFHVQCKGCHEKLSKTIKPGLPVMCGQCHVRKQ